MSDPLTSPCTAFEGARRFAAGPLAEVARAVLGAGDRLILVFDDRTGQRIDLDPRESDEALRQRLLSYVAPLEDDDPADEISKEPRGRGRPRLGVVAREVTLLPRHWAWLNSRPGGTSVALRRLVDEARKAGAAEDAARRAREAAYRFISATASDRPGFEEASRALFAGDLDGFARLMAPWPADLRDFALRLLANGAFARG
ncbi:MAG: DUF2239 family protein [Caulobacteraceae bacterium]|nr:DUF2239 family protein [Caulobacteraceae bacterium]